MLKISAVDGNDLIKSKILSGVPFIASKIGAVEKDVVASRLYNISYDRVRGFASNNAGITPNDDETLDFFVNGYVSGLKNVDMLGSMESKIEEVIIDNFARQAVFSELRYLEPFYFENPWSEALEGKNVLVIHPFEKTIINQYSNRELLFSNKKILPRFNLLTIKAEQTNGGGMIDSKPFKESLKIMKDKIDGIDFDVSVLGCGAYGLLLADYIKNKGKQAIHIGGGSQILFGIKGRRWEAHPEISSMFNNNWCRPLKEEKTLNSDVVEGSTYW